MTETDLWRRLTRHSDVAALCDILDDLGHRHQAIHHRLRPLLPDRENCGFVGRAQESLSRDELKAGRTLREVYDRYRVL